MSGGDTTLRLEDIPPQTKRGSVGRKPCADWEAIRKFVTNAKGKWCRVMTLTEIGKNASARLRERARHNLEDFECRTRTVGQEVRLYARVPPA